MKSPQICQIDLKIMPSFFKLIENNYKFFFSELANQYLFANISTFLPNKFNCNNSYKI